MSSSNNNSGTTSQLFAAKMAGLKTTKHNELPVVYDVLKTPLNASQLMSPELQPALEDWAKIFFNKPHQGIVEPGSEDSPAHFLSQFGLKTPQSVALFFLTPAGHTVIAEQEQHLALEEDIRNEQIRQYREHVLLMQRLKVALHLWYLSKKTHASKKLEELIIDQMNKAEKRLKKASEQNNSLETLKYKHELEDLIQYYDAAIDIARNEIKVLDKKHAQLEQELLELMNYSEIIEEKYLNYYQGLNQFLEENSSEDDDVVFENKHAEIKEKIGQLNENVQTRMKTNLDVKDLLDELYLSYLKIISLQDLHQVTKGNKYTLKLSLDGDATHFIMDDQDELMMLDTNDELMAINQESTNSLETSKLFYKKAGHRLIKDNGVVYLLAPDQDLELIKENPELRNKAKQAANESFSLAKRSILSASHLVSHHHASEVKENNNVIQSTKQILKSIKQEQIEMDNQVRLLQAAQADAKQSLQQLDRGTKIQANSTSSTPSNASHSRMTPSPSFIKNAPMMWSNSSPIKKELEIYGQKLSFFSKCTPSPRTRQAIDEAFNQRLKRGAYPLSVSELAALEIRMAAFSRVNPIAQENRYRSPTPFNMGLDPFKRY